MKTAKIAYRNLLRYSRRTLLTATLVIIGIVTVLVFIAVAHSFKYLMIGQITDSMLGHVQIHSKGYVASIDNSPLNLNLSSPQAIQIKTILDNNKNVSSFSPRIKFGGMLSSYTETSNIRLNGIDPVQELKTVPLLGQRVINTEKGSKTATLEKGEIWLPDMLASGMKLKIGDQVVLVATNNDGSVNGIPLIVSGIIEAMTGPGGRDGYLNIKDAYQLLRINEGEVNEVAVRLNNFGLLKNTFTELQNEISNIKNKNNNPAMEIHTWEGLTPFTNIAKILDLLTVFVKVILIAIVLVSIMNVMLMAVYERIREIGTITAIGTSPGKIRSMFLLEGLFLGIFGSVIGMIASLGIIQFLKWRQLTLSFGRQDQLILEPSIAILEIIITVLIVIIVSTLASLQPAMKASKLEPVDALRHI